MDQQLTRQTSNQEKNECFYDVTRTTNVSDVSIREFVKKIEVEWGKLPGKHP